MRFLFVITFLALSMLCVTGRKINDAQPDPSSFDDSPSALMYGLAASDDAQNWHEESWEKTPLVQRWRQWIRRQDETESSGNIRTTERRSKTRDTTQEDATTQDEATTTEDKATSTQNEVTTTNKPESTTQESTTEATSTQESSASLTMSSSSTETSSDSSSTTSSTITSTEPGASCYSTTILTSIVYSITTGGTTRSASYITNRITSSTCAPGLLCEIYPDSGVTVCMEQRNEVGTPGIVVAIFFGACIAGCISVLVGMCLRDKRVVKKYANIKRVKTLRAAERERKKLGAAQREDETNLMVSPSA
ncbi:uncharacterized protein FTOL_13603 [Fusarium torulosum]|uniref:Uncharacterized protein n=1 Tax=Fusarium torulosum TaxID=33205 RepID=A0AAE8MPB6_9HYPO|nr:uncharacterized protein FTOL_13603 [Fusarium torulosum]